MFQTQGIGTQRIGRNYIGTGIEVTLMHGRHGRLVVKHHGLKTAAAAATHKLRADGTVQNQNMLPESLSKVVHHINVLLSPLRIVCSTACP